MDISMNEPDLNKQIKFRPRIIIVLSALTTLFFAVWGGLLRVQWGLPVPEANWISYHGPLMVNGFFGTILGLARSNALKLKWGLLTPLIMVLGAWTLLLGGSEKTGLFLFFLASLVYLGICLAFLKTGANHGILLALAGGIGLAFSDGMWLLGTPIPQIVVGWQTLLVLTIGSERWDALHSGPTPFKSIIIYGIISMVLLGTFIQPFFPPMGIRLASVGYLLLSLILFRFDALRPMEKVEGWKRYTRACLFSGYGWLLTASIIGFLKAPTQSGFFYDAFLHSIFLGFVFSMVFSHAPLLLPRVLKTSIPFQPAFYLHWGLLQISLLVRIGGDVLVSAPWRHWGALLNAISLLVFFLSTGLAVYRGKQFASSKGFAQETRSP